MEKLQAQIEKASAEYQQLNQGISRPSRCPVFGPPALGRFRAVRDGGLRPGCLE